MILGTLASLQNANILWRSDIFNKVVSSQLAALLI